MESITKNQLDRPRRIFLWAILFLRRCIFLLVSLWAMTKEHNAQLMKMTEEHNAQLLDQTKLQNAQLTEMTELHNAQLMMITEEHNAQLKKMTEECNAQLAAQASSFQKTEMSDSMAAGWG